MRSKEEAHDYRYFPDPDLLPLELRRVGRRLARSLPELPDEKKARFMRYFALSAYDADMLVAERETADYFEAVVGGSTGIGARATRNSPPIGSSTSLRAAPVSTAGAERSLFPSRRWSGASRGFAGAIASSANRWTRAIGTSRPCSPAFDAPMADRPSKKKRSSPTTCWRCWRRSTTI